MIKKRNKRYEGLSNERLVPMERQRELSWPTIMAVPNRRAAVPPSLLSC